MVTDEKKLQFAKFQHDLFERVVVKESLDADDVMNAIRPLIGQGPKVEKQLLLLKGTAQIPKARYNKDDFFFGKLGIDVRMTPQFKKLIFYEVTAEVSCDTHSVQFYTLNQDANNERIRAAIGKWKLQTREQYLASIIWRLQIWQAGTVPEVVHLDSSGHHNVQLIGFAEKCDVVASCRFGGQAWTFDAYKYAPGAAWVENSWVAAVSMTYP